MADNVLQRDVNRGKIVKKRLTKHAEPNQTRRAIAATNVMFGGTFDTVDCMALGDDGELRLYAIAIANRLCVEINEIGHAQCAVCGNDLETEYDHEEECELGRYFRAVCKMAKP